MKDSWIKHRLALVMVTWLAAVVANAVAFTNHALRSEWTAACINAAVIAGISVLDLTVVRPKILQERRARREQEAAVRQVRVAELEKELGIG